MHGLKCLITKPTRVTEKSQTLLDVILTNKPELFKDTLVYDPGLSDHAMVIGTMAGNAIYHPRKVLIFRSIKKINEESFREDLSTAPWHVGSIFDSIDDQCFYWNSLFNNILDAHAPSKNIGTHSVRDLC